MRKILFVFSLFLSLSLILACSDDDNSDPKLSFGRPIYILESGRTFGRGVDRFGTRNGRDKSTFHDRRFCRFG